MFPCHLISNTRRPTTATAQPMGCLDHLYPILSPLVPFLIGERKYDMVEIINYIGDGAGSKYG